MQIKRVYLNDRKQIKNLIRWIYILEHDVQECINQANLNRLRR